ncbi:class I SAM-dependent methyltransferase [Fervidobacterium sp.]
MRSFRSSSDYYNSIANAYDNMYEDIYWTIAKQQIKVTIEKHIFSMSGLSVIDIGGGTGYWSLWTLKKGAKVVFVEPAQRMIEQAKEKIRKEMGMDLREVPIEFINCPAEDLDFHLHLEEKFDVILLLGDVLSYVDNLGKTMENISRATKKGALVFGTVDNYLSYLKDVVIYGSWEDYSYLVNHRKLPIGSEYGTFEAGAFEPAEIENIFEDYGFKVIELSALSSMPSLESSIKYGKYFIFESEHLFFVAKKV